MKGGQDCEEAVSAYRKALELEGTLSVAYLDLGVLYKHTGDIKKAIASYESALEHSSASSETKIAHLMLAILYSERLEWSSAKRHAQKARESGFVGIASDLMGEIERHAPNGVSAEKDARSQLSISRTQPSDRAVDERARSRNDTSAAAAESHAGVKADKGFFDGLFAPLGLVAIAFEAVASFSEAGREGVISGKIDALWNEGGGSYKTGFVLGILIVASLLGGGGTAASRRE